MFDKVMRKQERQKIIKGEAKTKSAFWHCWTLTTQFLAKCQFPDTNQIISSELKGFFFSFSISAMYAEHELECQTLAFL